MNFFSGLSDRRQAPRIILLTIILMTLPCYCLGAVLLATAPDHNKSKAEVESTLATLSFTTSSPARTPTAFMTFTPIGQPLRPTSTQIYMQRPTAIVYPTWTPFPTTVYYTWTPLPFPTLAPTLTPLPTNTLPPSPTLVPTDIPTNTPVPTDVPPPTATNTEVPTAVPTNTDVPTVEPSPTQETVGP